MTAARRRKSLSRLAAQMAAADRAVKTLHYDEVSAKAFAALNRILEQEVVVRDSTGSRLCELRNPESIDDALDAIWPERWHFGLQLDEHNLPRYTLFRTEAEGWYDADVAVEELHLSDGFEMPDDRYAMVRDFGGRERPVVRLAPYRAGAIKLLGRRRRHIVDRLLTVVGSRILLWTDEQRVLALMARHFGMPELLHAVEALAFMKRGEHNLVRYRLEEQPAIQAFFTAVYPNPPLAGLLDRIRRMSPATMSELPDRAEGLQRDLAGAIQRFLETKVTRSGGIRRTVEALVMANIFRLDLLQPELARSDTFTEAGMRLLKTCRALGEEVVAHPKRDHGRQL